MEWYMRFLKEIVDKDGIVLFKKTTEVQIEDTI